MLQKSHIYVFNFKLLIFFIKKYQNILSKQVRGQKNFYRLFYNLYKHIL